MQFCLLVHEGAAIGGMQDATAQQCGVRGPNPGGDQGMRAHREVGLRVQVVRVQGEQLNKLGADERRDGVEQGAQPAPERQAALQSTSSNRAAPRHVHGIAGPHTDTKHLAMRRSAGVSPWAATERRIGRGTSAGLLPATPVGAGKCKC